MRNLSMYKEERLAIHRVINLPLERFSGDRNEFIGRLRNALYAAVILTYAQGMAQLRSASSSCGYGFPLETVARIWRGGCIIRAAVLENIRAAFERQPALENLLIDPQLGGEVARRRGDLKDVVCEAVGMGIPVPGLMASLSYLDSYRSDWLPANLIQAQRDYFGAHTYERIDQKGVFHTQWIGQ
jgi:6-phosphogluconate dehydrogenase